jgi:outer membrane receptor protein involved in Fe transport
VDPTRSFETPVINEFAVPATAVGASWSGVWRHANLARTVAGFDLNYVSGEAREDLGYSNGAFTREYLAGGDQGMIGLFVSQEQRLSSTVRATFGARLDAWRDANGHQRETDSSNGVVLIDNRYPVDSDAGFSPSAGMVWQPEKELRFHANAQESSRNPRLGERYETYGHDFIVTEPNPDLRTEHNTSFEVGAEGRPAASVSLGATAFLNELRDTLGNLRIQIGSSEFPMGETLPQGYSIQQRINLDRARVQGLKLSASWQPGTAFSLDASLLFNDPKIVRSAIAPQLEGRQMAGVSRRVAIVSAKWQASGDLSFRFRVRSLGRQFVDDENTLRLGEAIVADVGANYAVTEHAELYLTAENLTDTIVATSRSSAGVNCIGAPRIVLCGVRLRW